MVHVLSMPSCQLHALLFGPSLLGIFRRRSPNVAWAYDEIKERGHLPRIQAGKHVDLLYPHVYAAVYESFAEDMGIRIKYMDTSGRGMHLDISLKRTAGEG